jgi:hypothetical protein
VEGTERAAKWMSDYQDRFFLNASSRVISSGVFNTNVFPHIIIGADVWGESGIMTGVY